MNHDIVRVAADDPDRCQQVMGTGQCNNRKAEGSTLPYCPAHIGAHGKNLEKASIRLYHINKWKQRLDQLTDHDQVKTLTEEIGVLRLLLENTLNLCKEEMDLLMHSAKISDLAIKIEKLVVSCHKLEKSSGALLDKSAIIRVAADIIEVISAVIDNYNVRFANFCKLLDDPQANAELIKEAVKVIRDMNLMNAISNDILEVIQNIRVVDEED